MRLIPCPDRFLSLLKAAHSAAGRSLVMIHYAGHGKVDVSWCFWPTQRRLGLFRNLVY